MIEQNKKFRRYLKKFNINEYTIVVKFNQKGKIYLNLVLLEKIKKDIEVKILNYIEKNIVPVMYLGVVIITFEYKKI